MRLLNSLSSSFLLVAIVQISIQVHCVFTLKYMNILSLLLLKFRFVLKIEKKIHKLEDEKKQMLFAAHLLLF